MTVTLGNDLVNDCIWVLCCNTKNSIHNLSAGNIANALVKHVVGESEGGSNDFFECFSTGFAKDSTPKLERSEIRRELVL